MRLGTRCLRVGRCHSSRLRWMQTVGFRNSVRESRRRTRLCRLFASRIRARYGQYFLLSGNRKLLEEVWPAIDRLTKTIEKVRDDDGLLSNLPGESFIDYADLETRGQSTAVNAFAVGCLRNAARIARAIGIPGRGGDLEFVASEIAEAVNDLLYDRERGVYMDGIVEGVRSKAFSEHANFLCALYGVADAQQTESILESAVRSRGSGAIRTTSPYFMFYSLELLYAKDRPADASSYFTIKWGRMLQQGATTFWELWQPTLSLCHIASTSPVYFLMAEVAGIQPTQPGWEEFNLHLLPGLLTWLRTTVPTPKGNITLAYHYRTGRAETLPDGQPVPFNNTQPTVAVEFHGSHRYACRRSHTLARTYNFVRCARERQNGMGAGASAAGCKQVSK